MRDLLPLELLQTQTQQHTGHEATLMEMVSSFVGMHSHSLSGVVSASATPGTFSATQYLQCAVLQTEAGPMRPNTVCLIPPPLIAILWSRDTLASVR